MTTNYLLDLERERAQEALRREDAKYLLAIGKPRISQEDCTLFLWGDVLAHDCPNKGAEIRNFNVHRLNERLDRIKHEVIKATAKGKLAYIYFIHEKEVA